MKMEVESKFNVGDRVRIDIYDEVDVVDVKFNDTEINQIQEDKE